jgi:hypothetical protein
MTVAVPLNRIAPTERKPMPQAQSEVSQTDPPIRHLEVAHDGATPLSSTDTSKAPLWRRLASTAGILDRWAHRSTYVQAVSRWASQLKLKPFDQKPPPVDHD